MKSKITVNLGVKMKYPRLLKVARYLAIAGYQIGILSEQTAVKIVLFFAKVDVKVS